MGRATMAIVAVSTFISTGVWERSHLVVVGFRWSFMLSRRRNSKVGNVGRIATVALVRLVNSAITYVEVRAFLAFIVETPHCMVLLD